MMYKVLVTGFTPFGQESVNPSYQAASLLPEFIEDTKIYVRELPTVFEKAPKILESYIDEIKPDAVICVGQAGGDAEISVERVGINLMSANIPDTEGNKPMDQPISDSGENAYFSTLPTREIVERLQSCGIPSKLSYSAGTYVCNNILYCLLQLVERKYPKMKGGFIHVPYMEKQVIGKPAGTPSMSLEMMTKALEEVIRCTTDNV